MRRRHRHGYRSEAVGIALDRPRRNIPVVCRRSHARGNAQHDLSPATRFRRGPLLFMHGVKLVHPDSPTDAWDDTTTLFITVYDGTSERAPVLGKGILRILPQDLPCRCRPWRSSTPSIVNNSWRSRPARAVLRRHVVRRLRQRGRTAQSDRRQQATGAQEAAVADDGTRNHWVKTTDGDRGPINPVCRRKQGSVCSRQASAYRPYRFPRIRSTRTCRSISTPMDTTCGCSTIAQVRSCRRRRPPSRSMTSPDGNPAAVPSIRQITGAPSVPVIAHCIGSMTFLMAMMGGLQGVRSAICSQLGTVPRHIDVE